MHSDQQKKHHSGGFSTLMVVIFLSLMLELILFSLLLTSKLAFQRSMSRGYSQEAYYAAEGVLHDTLLLLRQGSWPQKTPYNQLVTVGEVKVNRSVNFDKTKQAYIVEIESEIKSSKRKLVAEFTPENSVDSKQKKIQVVFILDTSDSMKTPLPYLKNAVTDMIDSGTFSTQDQLAVVEFNTKARVVTPFTLDRELVKNEVRKLKSVGGTNTISGLQVAHDHIQKLGDPNAAKVIILFSDGVPTLGLDAKNKQTQCVEGCFNQYFANEYAPNKGGNQCTDSTIKKADALHGSSEVSIYTIFFARQNGGSCGEVAKNQELGRLTLQQIAGDHSRYFETDQINEFKGIFQAIGKSVIENKEASYFYQEVEPEENSEVESI